MPVVNIELKRLERLVGATSKVLLQRLPYIGLDIESVEGGSVRVEYSPNRPDFGTDYGIARALRGLLGVEVGLPRYKMSNSGIRVKVDRALSHVRPFIACVVASGLKLDNEDIRQLISLQEDLHEGLGRRRRRVAIGMHDLARVKPPIYYKGLPPTFSFIPLDMKREMSLAQILKETDVGRRYSGALEGARVYPVILDDSGTVLSFPPIVNGSTTKVTHSTSRMLVDVTSTDRDAGNDVLAVLASTLGEMGGTLGAVEIVSGSERFVTPDTEPRVVPLDSKLVREITGLELTEKEITQCIRKSRMDVKGKKVLVPRYRVDILHRVDIAEEVALGYGIDKIGPIYPASDRPGKFNPFDQFLDGVADLMADAGFIEVMTYELTDSESLYGKFGRPSDTRIEVENPRSAEHSVLRDSLMPCILSVLARNVKEEYPQRIFEVGRVYSRDGDVPREEWHLAALSAHAAAGFTEAKMYLESFCSISVGASVSTPPAEHWAFIPGRSASIMSKDVCLGHIGEVRPEALVSFGLTVPAAGFELSLRPLWDEIGNS